MITSLLLKGFVDAVHPKTAYALVEHCNELGIEVNAGYCTRSGQEGLCWVTIKTDEEE